MAGRAVARPFRAGSLGRRCVVYCRGAGEAVIGLGRREALFLEGGMKPPCEGSCLPGVENRHVLGSCVDTKRHSAGHGPLLGNKKHKNIQS